MKLFSRTIIDYFRFDQAIQSRSQIQCSQKGFSCQMVDRRRLNDVLTYRSASVRDSFSKFLSEGRQGAYVYDDKDVVGHAWLHMTEDSLRSKPREIFGWLPIPAGWDFIFFCKGTTAGVVKMLLSHFTSRERIAKGCIGISVPREDGELRAAVLDFGFVFSHTITRFTVLGRTIYLRSTRKLKG